MLGRHYEDLVDVHPLRLGHGVGYAAGDVLGLEHLDARDTTDSVLGFLVGDVVRQRGRYRPRLDDCQPDAVFGKLAPQRLGDAFTAYLVPE